MDKVLGKISPAIGRFHYWKWVYIYRYEQQFGKSFTQYYNYMFGAMMVWMLLDSHQRQAIDRSKQYHARKAHIEAESHKCWVEERAVHDLNVAELEEAVFRARKHEVLPELKDEKGQAPSFNAPPVVVVRLPIAPLKDAAKH